MDDAQQIVLVALQQAGIEVPEGAKAGNEVISSSALVTICAQAVNILLRNGGSIPTKLPAGTAERFRVCTDLAGAVKLLGYRGDLSFHQFLYPSPKDTHKLLRFLLDKLSSSSSSSSTPQSSSKIRKSRTFRRSVSSTAPTRLVVDALTKAHGDSHRAESGLKELSRFQTCVLRTSVVKTVDGAPVVKPTLVTLQAKPRHSLIPSLLELNAKNATIRVASSDNAASASSGDVIITSRGEFLPHQLSAAVSNELRLIVSTKDAEVEGDGSKAAEALLQQQVRELQAQADRMEAEAQAMEGELSLLKCQHESKEQEIRQLEGEMAVLREAVQLGLDPSNPNAISELQEELSQGEEHMASLQAEWEAVRQPLEEKKASLERERLSSEGELASKATKLKELRHQLLNSTEKLRVREQQAWTLETDLKEISSRPKRASYVHRITELVKNSQKQETDIAKIITDTRVLQRDSNATNDRLRRTYALVDELVFRDAKKDPVCRQSYRQLTTIHETFADIVDKVLEMDKTGREIAELQAQLEELQKSSLDVQSVQKDLDAVAIETHALERRLASVQASNILIPA